MSLTFAQLRDAARALYLGRRHAIEHAEKHSHTWRDGRPPEWFIEQRARLDEIRQIGVELAFIAEREAAYLEWKASRA